MTNPVTARQAETLRKQIAFLTRDGGYRIVCTDSESPDGIIPVCTSPDHPQDDRVEQAGVYDCCDTFLIETHHEKFAAFIIGAMAAVPALLDERERNAALIGPLTAAEWCSLRLTEGDDDPLYCCGASSEFRSALFHVLRMGADANLAYYLAEPWQALVAYGHGEGDPLLERIRDFYRLDNYEGDAPASVGCDPHCDTPCHVALREVEQERDHWKFLYEMSQKKVIG